jgi:hypothetical protein
MPTKWATLICRKKVKNFEGSKKTLLILEPFNSICLRCHCFHYRMERFLSLSIPISFLCCSICIFTSTYVHLLCRKCLISSFFLCLYVQHLHMCLFLSFFLVFFYLHICLFTYLLHLQPSSQVFSFFFSFSLLSFSYAYLFCYLSRLFCLSLYVLHLLPMSQVFYFCLSFFLYCTNTHALFSWLAELTNTYVVNLLKCLIATL